MLRSGIFRGRWRWGIILIINLLVVGGPYDPEVKGQAGEEVVERGMRSGVGIDTIPSAASQIQSN